MTAERLRRRPRAETRKELLDAAARVFARQGLHGTSVEAVAEEAGFSRGALYSNFAGKEELFLTLYEQRIERRRRELRGALEGADTDEAGIASVGAELDEVFQRDRDWFLLYFEFALHAARDPGFARRFKAVREEGLAELAEGLADGLAAAGLEPMLPPRDLARVVRALAYGLALDGLVESDSQGDELLRRVLGLVLRAARARAETGHDLDPDSKEEGG